MKNPDFVRISWTQLENDCFILAEKLQGIKFDKIVAISRGGLVWARVLSDLLQIPISHMTIESYKNLRQEKETMISEAPVHALDDKIILLIDEIADSGKTLKRALSYFQNFPIKKIYVLTPYIKSKTKVVPDFYVHKLDSWIIFPYELKETFIAFSKILKSKKKAAAKMISLGIERKLVRQLIKQV